MKILASPARRNRDRNPFNFLLSEALAAQGCTVTDLDGWNGVLGSWDVFHIHWPQHATRGRKRQALLNTAALLALLVVLRLRGTRIVWTVHNVRSHDGHNAGLERALMALVARLVHGVIFLSPSSRSAACEEMPVLACKAFAVIPHGLYGEVSGRSRTEARALFGLPVEGPVVGVLGDIRQYKGIELVLDALAETRPADVMLFVAGAFQHAATPEQRAYITAVRERIGALQRDGHAIVFREGRLDDAALTDAIRAVDLIAMPYRAIWNSGFALLVLENRGRILAADAPVFRELQQELGPGWVQVVEGAPTGAALVSALRNAPLADEGRLECFGAARSWTKIATAARAFYHRLGAGRRKAAMVSVRRPSEG